MNAVSWFLYAADVLNNIQGIFVIASVVLGIALILGLLFHGIECNEFWGTGCKIITPIIVFLSLFAAVIPSKNTMYAIAASEVGERVINSDSVHGVAADATKALQQWIKRQIEPEKKS